MSSGPITRRHALRQLGLGGLALAAPGALAACGSSEELSHTRVDHVTWAVLALDTLNVPAKGDFADAATLLTEPILKLDERLNVVGHLAESWKAVDPLTYVYRIRRGVRYWDGSALTPEDVAYAIERHVDPKTGSYIAGIIPALASVRVTGPDEVTVKLEKANATWAYIPTYILVAPKRFYQRLGKDFGTPGTDTVMGSGPYRLMQYRAGDRLELEENPTYWGPKPVAKRLSLRVIRDAQARLLAMRSGEIDGTFDVNSDIADKWKRISGVKVIAVPSGNYSFFSFDLRQPPWNDLHLRRAIAHAIDREGLAKALFHGNVHLAESIVPRAAWGRTLSEERLDRIYGSLRQYEFDLDKARQELAQSAYASGGTGTVWYYQNTTTEKICLTLQENLKKIGFTLKLETPPDAEGDSREDEHHDLGFHYDGWGTQIDPVDQAVTLLPSYARKSGYYNMANYSNPTVDRLLEQNLRSTDVTRRANLLARIMQIVAEDLPYIPMFTVNAHVAVKEGFAYRGHSALYKNQMWIEHLGREGAT
jgi:peptide/nickel transport system substrate-binding protein